ncbi:MAG: hypothetical protein NTY16_07145 [Deltaproteobacteria bacterium]|nr:hypothetical protein [Deltaproteobacteria bacterium]
MLISKVRKIFMPLLLSGIFLLAWTSLSRSADYQQLPGLIDLRTTFSDGAYDVETLVYMAKERGFGVVILNDHDLMVMEYGLPPLRNLISKKEEKNSILKSGVGKYIQAIKNVRKKYPDMIIIPGSESTAFYYWTGSPFQGNLTAHDHEKRILTIGMENPSDYEGLPMLHNSHSIQFLHHDLPGMILLFAAVLSAVVMIYFPGILRITGIIVLTLAVLFIINSNPFRNSPYDPYHGDQGMAPYQLLVDYVNARSGMTFWNYPETKSGVRKMGPIQVSTRPYPEVLLDSRGYTGFSALYGENIRITEPGGVWDMVLKEYCQGFRDRPAWGIATADFHREGEGGEKLGNYQTVFYVKEKKITEVLEALRNGRMYAAQGKFPQIFRMDEFSLSSADGKVKGISGDEVAISEKPHIKIVLSSEKPVTGQVKVRLIRGGEVIKMTEGALPLQIEHEDDDIKPGEKTYYRMDMHGAGTIVSNPIFMTRPR